MRQYDVAIIGGGIIGLATARAFYTLCARSSLVVIEAESSVASHQTGHNSGVIHSGLYYKPGSLKARYCTLGREEMIRFCDCYEISYERCGKIIVATNPNEIPALDELERRGRENGLKAIRRLSSTKIRDYEPHARGIDGLWVGETGVLDYTTVATHFASFVEKQGGEVKTHSRLLKVRRENAGLVLETSAGEIHCRFLINCGGLHSDRVARLCGLNPQVQIIPFRGEYYELVPTRRHLVRNLIYPVPDPRFPFLGVHFTRMIGGGVEAGPNAVLALKREGYHKWNLSLRDTADMIRYRGFWKMASRYWSMGLGELYRSMSKRAFVNALQRLLPDLQSDDLKPAGTGVRAQAVNINGELIDDFHIVEAERMIHVLNAPSPAATASIVIGEHIARKAKQWF